MFSNRDLLKLIIPLIIEQILAVTVGLADGVMVARVGEAAISGVSIVDSINTLLIGLFSAVATGGAVVASQYLGQKDAKKASKAGEQLIASNLALSTIIMIIALLGRNFILNALFGDVEPDVMKNARIYFYYTAISYPFLGVYNACAALFRSMGNSGISMIISVMANVLNIIGNSILIFILKNGCCGCGYTDSGFKNIFSGSYIYSAV